MAKLRVSGAAALVATYGLLNVVTAQAATIQQTITLTTPQFDQADVYSTSAFNEFDPALGTLTGVSVALFGIIDWENSFGEANPSLQVDLVIPGTNQTIAGETFTSYGTHTLLITGNFFAANVDVSLVEGLGTTDFDLLLDNGLFRLPPDEPGDTFSANLGSVSHVTYTYIPAVTATPLPAALPLFAGGLGALGLLGWRRKRRAQAIAA